MTRPLSWIALGAFAIGTEGFMLAGLLPAIAADVGVSVSLAGQLVTAFSVAYALGSPLLAVATGDMERKRLLMGAMAAFAAGNVVAAAAHGYAALLAARILMALAAGTFMPAASAYAAAQAAPERRGRSLSVIYAGMTLATVVGVPLGVLVGGRLGWRHTFGGVAVLAALAVAGMWRAVRPARGGRGASLAERLAVARRPDVLGTLALTALALAGAFTVYTYIAPFLDQAAGVRGSGLATVLLVFGAGGAVGNILGGLAADRLRWRRLLAIVLGALAAIYGLLSLSAHVLAPGPGLFVTAALVLLWGLVGWSVPSIQQTRLVGIDPRLASVTLSLNASATYVGISLGAALGSIAVARGQVLALGWLAGALVFAGLLLVRLVPEPAPAPVAAEDRTSTARA